MNLRWKAGAKEHCGDARMQRVWKVHVWCSQYMWLSVLLYCFHAHTKFSVPEVHFHAKSIGASPIALACKTEKFFNFLHSQIQCDCTIHVVSSYSCSDQHKPATKYMLNRGQSNSPVGPKWEQEDARNTEDVKET